MYVRSYRHYVGLGNIENTELRLLQQSIGILYYNKQSKTSLYMHVRILLKTSLLKGFNSTARCWYKFN